MGTVIFMTLMDPFQSLNRRLWRKRLLTSQCPVGFYLYLNWVIAWDVKHSVKLWISVSFFFLTSILTLEGGLNTCPYEIFDNLCSFFFCLFVFITKTKTFNKRISTKHLTREYPQTFQPPPPTFFTLLRQISLCLQKWASLLPLVRNYATERSVSQSLIHKKRE